MALLTQTSLDFLLLGMSFGRRRKTGFAPVDIKTAKATGRRPMTPKAPRKKRGR